jgi:hypothetical protein
LMESWDRNSIESALKNPRKTCKSKQNVTT